MMGLAAIRTVLVFTLVVQIGSEVAFGDEPTTHDTSIRCWIEQLDSKQFQVRHTAHANLVQAEKPARDLLRAIGDEITFEVKARTSGKMRNAEVREPAERTRN
jgi:pyruvate-formate lyase-activating enzyme